MARRKPNPSSVTAVECKCRFLERAAAEPKQAIVFDEDLNEYHIENPGGGYWLIHHCPSCGGAAPASRRHERFATVTTAEAERLEGLTSDLKTVEEALAALGKAQYDYAHGLRIHNPARGKKPPEVASYRTLRFTRLSDVADVTLTDFREKGIRFSSQGKYLGKPKGRPTKR